MIGQKFGTLTVVREDGYEDDEYTCQKRMMYIVKCDCGRHGRIMGKRLKDGKVSTCDKCKKGKKKNGKKNRNTTRTSTGTSEL